MHSMLAAVLSLTAALAYGQVKPVAGMWHSVAAVGPTGNVLARTHYVLTDEPLAQAATFSGLEDRGGSLEVVCCIEVRNLTPLDIKNEIVKYAADEDIVAHLKSIRGLRYMYQANIGPKSQHTALMTLFLKTFSEQMDGSTIAVPVISATLGKRAVPYQFLAGDSHISVARPVHSQKTNRLSYQLTIDGRPTRFSVEAQGD